jgi:hypothetical protein
MNILIKFSSALRISFSVILNLLPSHRQICEHSCNNFLCYRNFFLLSFAFVTKSWNKFMSILTKVCYVSLLSPSFPKIIIQEFLFCSFRKTCGASFLFPSSLEIIIHEFFSL